MMTKKLMERLTSFKMMLSLAFVAAILFVGTIKLEAQASGPQEEVFVVADENPVYPGGPKALMDFIYKNVTYPEDAKEQGIQGKVIVRFVVDKEGKPTQAIISKGLSPSIDKEVLRVIAKLPKFTPGKMGGKPVSVWYAVPITFRVLTP